MTTTLDYTQRSTNELHSEFVQVMTDLADQVLRSVAGAGKPHQLPDICRYLAACADEMEKRKATPDVSTIFDGPLSYRKPRGVPARNESEISEKWRERCLESIVQDSLRLAASRFRKVHHLPERNALRALTASIRDYNEANVQA